MTENLGVLVREVNYVTFEGDYQSHPSLHICYGCSTDQSAKAVATCLSKLLEATNDVFRKAVANFAQDQSPKIQLATKKWADRFTQEASTLIRPEQVGSTTIIDLKDESLLIFNTLIQSPSMFLGFQNSTSPVLP